MRKTASWIVAALVCGAASSAGARAEDMRGRWSFGIGAGILSTKDDIRSNAAGLVVNEKGVPDDYSDDFVVTETIDLRADDLLGRETSIEERQFYNFSVSYGLTSWLSLQLDVGRYSGDVSNLDTFRVDRRLVDINNNLIIEPDEFVVTPPKDASVPISAGTLEQVPVSFSAVFRFRKDSPFNPILGAGVGMIFTDFQESGVFQDLNQEILRGFQRTQLYNNQAVNSQLITDRYANIIADTNCAIPANSFDPTYACTLGQEQLADLLAQFPDDPEIQALLKEIYGPSINEAFIPKNPFITAEVDDAFEYHFMGGAEYHFNENWSAYIIGRYAFTRADMRIHISDNGNIVTASQTADASQAIQFDTDQARFAFLAESNCDQVAQADQGCLISPGTGVRDEIMVQGGEINLSSFTLGFGLRVSF